MLRDLVDKLQELITTANTPVVHALDERTVGVAVKGELTERPIPAPLRDHACARLVDLMKAIEVFASVENGATIFHSLGLIEAELNNADRLDVVRMPLILSEQFSLVEQLGVQRDQRTFVLFLREKFEDALPEGFLNTIRSVKFESHATGHGVVKQGHDSLGRAVESKVESTLTAIPERIELTFPLYCNEDLPWQIQIPCQVFIDTESQRFALQPLPDAANHAVMYVHSQLHGVLETMCESMSDAVTVIEGRRGAVNRLLEPTKQQRMSAREAAELFGEHRGST